MPYKSKKILLAKDFLTPFYNECNSNFKKLKINLKYWFQNLKII